MRMRKTALMGVILLATAAWAQTNLSLPAGTAFKVKLEKTLSTFTSKEGDPFSGRVLDPVVLDGKTVIPVGATVQGRVTKINEPRRIAAVLVDTNLHNGSDVNTEGQFKGDGHDGKDLTEVGFGTGSGMLVGGLAGGGKGLLIGGAVGATLTVAHWLGKKRSAMLPSGTELMMELSRPLEMTAASGGQ